MKCTALAVPTLVRVLCWSWTLTRSGMTASLLSSRATAAWEYVKPSSVNWVAATVVPAAAGAGAIGVDDETGAFAESVASQTSSGRTSESSRKILSQATRRERALLSAVTRTCLSLASARLALNLRGVGSGNRSEGVLQGRELGLLVLDLAAGRQEGGGEERRQQDRGHDRDEHDPLRLLVAARVVAREKVDRAHVSPRSRGRLRLPASRAARSRGSSGRASRAGADRPLRRARPSGAGAHLRAPRAPRCRR